MPATRASRAVIDIDGIEYEVDENGFLLYMSDWSRAVAAGMASHDGIELDAEHWEVILFLREYYLEYRIAPAMRVLKRVLEKRLGPDKASTPYLYELFPFGPAKPTGCV